MREIDRLGALGWALLAGIAGLLAAGLLRMETLETVPLCLFRFLTGLPCPGCGMTHSLLHAFQGEWAAAWVHHPLGIPMAAAWTLWLALGVKNLRGGKGFSDGFPLTLTGWRGPAVLALVLGVYGMRLAGSFF